MAVVAAHGGHAGHQVHNRAQINRVGLWLFFFSESIIFGLLATSRFYLLGIERDHVDQLLGLGITIILLLSSVSAYIGETAIEHGNRKIASWGLLATIIMGLIFAVGVGFEWATAHFHKDEAYGTLFFAMTGTHALHVLSGVFMLILAWNNLRRGWFGKGDTWGISSTVMYWHFVDVVWVFFYPILYLVS